MKQTAVIISNSWKQNSNYASLSEDIFTVLKSIPYQIFESPDFVNPKEFMGLMLLGLDADNHSLADLVIQFHKLSSPIACVGESVVVVAKALGKFKVNLAFHADDELEIKLKEFGADPIDCPNDDFISDRDCKVLSTPCFLRNSKEVSSVRKGLVRITKELVEMV